MVKKVSIPLSALFTNVGQIEGLPPNPRLIKDEKFEALKKSLTDDPEMLDLRELIVYPNPDEEGTYVVIGGNMRYNAAKELGLSELPCKILPESTPVEKMRSFIIKDNIAYGEWDMDLLADDWDTEELADWGLDLPDYCWDDDEVEQESTPENYSRKIEAPIYEPKGVCPCVTELYDTRKRDELISEIDSLRLPKEVKDFLTHAAGRHTVFNYERIADFYAHSEKKVQALMEKSALVIIDFDKAIENGFVKMTKDLAEAYKTEQEDDEE